MKYKFITILVLSLLASLGRTTPVLAQYYQPSENKKEIILDKQIQLNDNYVDNIAASQKVFVEREIVNFKVIVTNTGNEKLTDLSVVDMLPNKLTMVFYPGVYNQNDNSIRWTIDSLEAGESKTYMIRTRVAVNDYSYDVDQCNFSEVKNSDVYDSDKSCYFISGKNMPETGANVLLIGSLLGLVTLGSGSLLRKYSRGY